MSTPAVRIAPGTGIALRTAGIIAWFDPAPHEHPTLLVRNLIAAARDSGGLPQRHLSDLAHNTRVSIWPSWHWGPSSARPGCAVTPTSPSTV